MVKWSLREKFFFRAKRCAITTGLMATFSNKHKVKIIIYEEGIKNNARTKVRYFRFVEKETI